jgi:choline kinase
VSLPISIVINCAGMGRRLGLSQTKAMVTICGRPLIAWQLDALQWAKDIRIVVGYRAEELIEYVNSTRNARHDIIYVFNRDYAITGTAASLVAGAVGSENYVVSLDGDLIVRPHDLRSFVELCTPALGIVPTNSDEPLAAFLDQSGQVVTSFKESSESELPAVEWSGLCQLKADQIAYSNKVGQGRGNIYELVAPHLPLLAVSVDAREIDTPDDFERAEQWLKTHLREWSTL